MKTMIVLILGLITSQASAQIIPFAFWNSPAPYVVNSTQFSTSSTSYSSGTYITGVPTTKAGHLFVIIADLGDGISTTDHISSIIDNKGSTWVSSGTTATYVNRWQSEIWYSTSGLAGVTKFKITTANGTTIEEAWFVELANMNMTSPVDQAAALNNQNNASAVYTGASITTTTAVCVIFSVLPLNDYVVSMASGSVWTQLPVTESENGAAMYITPGPGTYTPVFQGASSGGGVFDNLTVSFKAQGS